MSVIGKLRVLLGLDSSEFVSGTKKAEQSNEKLNKSLKQAKNTVDATTASTTRHAQAAQQSAQATQQQTTQAQQATKKFNTLNFQIQQVARELPSLALGPQMFFLALSNNLPMLTDEVARAKKEYKELAAAGEKATPVWKQMLSGILSWQTALVVGITLLVAYGKEIGNFVSELFTGKKAFDAAEVAASNFHRAMTEGVVNAAEETTKLDLLYKAATDNKKSYEDRKTAAEELQSIYPAYFGNLATEQIMIGKAVSKYNDLRTAIIETSRARAALDMTTELQKELLILENTGDAFDDLRQKAEKANEAREAYKYATPQYSFSEGGNREITPEKFQLERAERAVEKATERIKEKLLKLSGGKELWDKIEEDFNGNVLDFAETANQTIERLAPKAELSLTVKTPEDLNEEAKKATERAAAAARKAYESTLAYSESENSKAIAALEKEQGAYGTTIAYMEKMLQLRREQETYAKSEAEYQQRKKVNDELQKQIELMKQVSYAPGSEADLKAWISALQDEISRLDPITDRMRIKEAMAEIQQLEEQVKNLPQNYKIEFEVDLKSEADQLDSQLKDFFENDEYLKGLKETTKQAEEIADQFKSVFTSTMIDSFNVLAESIAGVSNMNAGQAVASLLAPLADMAISAGTIIMFSGEAIESLKKALTSFLGIGAVAAGAALVGVGIAAKAGLSALAKGSSGTTNATNYNTFTGGGSNSGYSNNGAYRYAVANVTSAGTNVTVDVKGALRGEDIALAVKKVTYNKSR